MAGGKETPRQKLIGLMYLVLTALLALNVSKQILDAFVAIEENIHRGSEVSQERGQQLIGTLTGDLLGAQSTNDYATVKRIKQCLAWIKEIDKDVDEFIQFSDKLKIDMINAVEGKEKLTAENVEKGGPILLKKSSYKGADFLKPHKLNLNAIDKQDEFDKPMAILQLHEIADVKKGSTGMKLWENYLNVRHSLVTKAGTYTDFKGNKWKLGIGKHINDFEDNKKLAQAIEKLFKSNGNKVNPMDNATLVEVYQALTKKEFSKYHDQTRPIHWVGRTFDHSPLVGALASISSLQNEVLAARLKIVSLIKQRQGGGEFTFNSIRELVSGPGVATAGEDIELYVTMAAYNSDKNPDVSSSTGTIDIKDGIGVVKFKAGQSDMTINGKVSIKNSMGTTYEKPWEWKVAVAKPQGSISLPEMNVLYRGYENKVVPVVAGAVSSSISATNATVIPNSFNVNGNSYNGYIVKPLGGTSTVLTLNGKDKDGKSKTYAVVKYTVRDVPDPVPGTDKFSKRGVYRIDLILKGSALNVKFIPTGGYIQTDDGKVNFQGAVIPGSAVAKLKPGSIVPVVINCTGPGGTRTIKSALTVIP